MEQKQPLSRRKYFVFGVFTFLFLFCLLFLASELVLRTMYPVSIPEIESVHDYTQLNSNYGLEPKPNLNYMEYGIPVQTNSMGMFNPEVPREKKGKRIAYLGDSYTIGPGIHYKDNFPWKVTQNLKKHIKDLDYVVGGLGGSSAMPQALLFEKKVIQFSPDIVVYELYDGLKRDYYWHYGPYTPRITVWNAVPDFMRQSQIVQRLMLLAINKKTQDNEAFYTKTKDEAFKNEKALWDNYTAQAIDRIYTLTKENNAIFFLVCLPSGKQFNDEYEKGPATITTNTMCTNAKEWAKKRNIPFADLYTNLQKANTEELNELYLDEAHGFHLTVKGAHIVTEDITTLIRSSLKE